MKLYLVRHTKPEIEQGICYGKADLDLADSFEEELKVVKTKLPEPFELIFASPAKRCLKLARGIETKEIEFKKDLWEMSFGDWEGQYWKDIKKDQLRGWNKDIIHNRPPGGETYFEVQNRSWAVLLEAVERNHNEIALICHGAVIRALICKAIGLDLTKAFNLSVDFGAVSVLDWDGKQFKLDKINL